MNRVDAVLWCLCITIVSKNLVGAEHDAKGRNDTLRINVFRGITLYVTNDEASVTLNMSSLLRRNEVEQRSIGRLKFKNGILQRLGMAMMMAPLLIQMASLPGALASIKMSLLRSILVGKIALAVMLYNTLKSSQKSEVVVIHKPEYHEHYYNTYHEPEDDDEGWWGRRMKRRFSKWK